MTSNNRIVLFLIISILTFTACGESENTSSTKSDDSEPECSVVFQKGVGYTYENCSSVETQSEPVNESKVNHQSPKREIRPVPTIIPTPNTFVPLQRIGNSNSSNQNSMGRYECEYERRMWDELSQTCLSFEETKRKRDRKQAEIDEMNCSIQGGRWDHPPNNYFGNKICLPSKEKIRQEFDKDLASNCRWNGGNWDIFAKKCNFPPAPKLPSFTSPTPSGGFGGFGQSREAIEQEEKEKANCRSSGGTWTFGSCSPGYGYFDKKGLDMLKKECLGYWNSFTNKCDSP